MEWKFGLPRPAMLVYYFAKLAALAPFTVKKNRLYSPTLIDALYLIGIAAAHAIVGIITFDLRVLKLNRDDYFQVTNLLMIIQHFGSSPGVFFGLGILLLMSKRLVYIVNKLCDLGNDIKSMGIREDHEENFKNIFVTIVKANVVLMTTCVVLCVLETRWSIYISIKYCVECWFFINMVLGFAQILLYIKRRFTLINERLSEPLAPTRHAGSLDDDLRTLATSWKPRGENLTDLQLVRRIEAVHLELGDLVDRTTNLFAAPIIFVSMHALTVLLVSSYWTYANSRYSTESPISYVPCPLIRTVILVLQLFAIAYASTTTCDEGNATKAVLSRIWDASTPKNLNDEFSMFSLQLLHKPVAVSVLDFFSLDYSYLYKIFCTVVAYLIIVVQFDKTEASPFLLRQ